MGGIPSVASKKPGRQLPVGAPVVRAQLPEALQRVRGHYEQDVCAGTCVRGPC